MMLNSTSTILSATIQSISNQTSSYAISIILDSVVTNRSSNETRRPSPYCKPNWTESNITMSICCTLIFCLSVVGNCLVIVTIIQQRSMRTVTNYYLLNLAISDLLLSVICMPATLLGFLLRCFIFGKHMCKILAYLQPVAVTASSYTLAVIALERYFAICKPLHSRHWQTRSHAVKMILLVWVISFVSNVSFLVIMESVEYRPNMFNCKIIERLEAKFWLGHQVVITISLFLLPLLVMTALYGIIIKTLWLGIKLEKQVSMHANSNFDDDETCDSGTGMLSRGRTMIRRLRKSVKLPNQRSPSVTVEDSDSPSQMMRSQSASARPSTDMALRSTHSERNLLAKKRVIKMLLVVMISFFVCWTPLFIFMVYIQILRVTASRMYPILHKIHYGFVILSYTSCCTNPIAYCFLNRKFRYAFLTAFGCKKLIGGNDRLNSQAASQYTHNNNHSMSQRFTNKNGSTHKSSTVQRTKKAHPPPQHNQTPSTQLSFAEGSVQGSAPLAHSPEWELSPIIERSFEEKDPTPYDNLDSGILLQRCTEENVLDDNIENAHKMNSQF